MIAVVQFDAASASLLDRLGAEGGLPNLAALRRRGRRVELDTAAAHFPASAYQCLYRGVEVGEHGLYYPFQWSSEKQAIRLAAEFPAAPPIWERLAEKGRTTLAIDPYECHAPRAAEGLLVCGWGMRERVVLERWSVPAGADRALRRRHGRPPNVTEIFGGRPGAEVESLAERLLGAPARVADLAIEQLRERRFDLVWLTFAAPHLGGHRLWGSPALADVYAEVDRQLGRVLEALPEDADVIVCSVLGMDVNTSRADLLPGMLAAVLGDDRRNGGADSDSGAMWQLRAALSGRVRGAVAAAMPDRMALELTARMELRGVDWSATRAFAQPADNQGYVRLNLKGREREGVVDPGEADELIDRIAAGLEGFRDPDGEPAVAAVDRVGGEWEGSAADRLPDLVVRWRPTSAVSIEALHSDRFGMVRRHGYGSGRTGNHTDGDAWAIVAPGASRLRDPDRPARVTDIAATVAALSGADSTGLVGEPLLER
ncbi:MAG TPA: alkaline phosphatase family protein [Solirubrobacterales bacterium]|nr:alkaline phosphatase family protein [Solirubrobacterales bacterium]